MHTLTTSIFQDMNVHAVSLADSMEGVVAESGSLPIVFPGTAEMALPTVRDRDSGVALVDMQRHTIREILLPQ